ncbi:c-type cytochrome biogenesis protein CcsB [Streptomyces sp. NPDC059506]|uniref:c-type cytochrome biogenesis protein CcsB n=1 Tax=Streptomyces TaxID=1883 RepID=UPI0021756344|nr:c-type cytochrome biogenesis protein CcsB [Streptomyces sp. SCUT-3]
MNIAAAANENMAQLSNYLVYSALAVYTLAFLAHIAEWAFGSRSRIAKQSAALTAQEQEAKASAAAPAVTVRAAGGTATLERPKVVTRNRGRDVADGLGAAGEDEKGELLGRIAISLTTLAFLIHLAGVVTRGLSVERAPWANMYEFSTTFSMVAVGVYLGLLAAGKKVRWIGLFLITTVLLDLGLALTVLYTESDQLVPALQSPWLIVHVACAIICGASFYVGAVSSLAYLVRDSYESRLEAGRTMRLSTVWRRLPSAATLDKLAYRVNAIVFPLWTFTIIAGAIWAEAAWGRYWGWDPKETWSFITWVVYAAYLHARATAGWKGRKAAYLALIAFACWIFNYYGVNMFVTGSLHSYAGVE